MRDSSDIRAARFEAAKPVDLRELSERWQELQRTSGNRSMGDSIRHFGTAEIDGSRFQLFVGRLMFCGPQEHFANNFNGIHAVEHIPQSELGLFPFDQVPVDVYSLGQPIDGVVPDNPAIIYSSVYNRVTNLMPGGEALPPRHATAQSRTPFSEYVPAFIVAATLDSLNAAEQRP